MVSARIVKTNDPLVIEDVNIPKPKNLQVLVKVKAAGICHSDLHLWEGGYMGAGGKFMKVEDRGVHFPLTPGHEVSGVIEEIGESVLHFQKGDNVLVYPWIGDQICRSCKSGDEHLCEAPQTLGIYQDGGYSDLLLVPSFKYLIKLSNMDFNSSASLACSGLTAYTAIKKTAAMPGENLVIIGAGGLGLMAVQIAKSITNANVVIMDVDDEKLKEAKKLGADITVNSMSTDPVKAIKDITNGKGCEVLVDFVNNNKTAPTAIEVLRKRGRYIMVGLFGGSLELNLPLVPLRAFTITGAYTGGFNDLVELVSLFKAGKINSVVSKHYKLEEANNALEDLKNRKIIGRAVFNP
jgi:alcohol dehydrogenase, propanol-preferring